MSAAVTPYIETSATSRQKIHQKQRQQPHRLSIDSPAQIAESPGRPQLPSVESLQINRSRNHPKLPDTFKRLRAQAKEPKTTNAVQDWLRQIAPALSKPVTSQNSRPPLLPPPSHPTRQLRSSGSTSRAENVLPLQSTHTNRQPPPTRTNLKRKMPNSFDTPILRQSARLKKPNVKSKDDAAIETRQRARKLTRKSKESDTFDVAGDVREDEELSGSDDCIPDDRRLAREMQSSKILLFKEAATKIKKSTSTNTSPSKRSGSPSKGSIAMSKRERMQFMEPPIIFRTLIATKNNGNLNGKLQRLWLHHIHWDRQKIIPSKFKEAMKRESDTPNKTCPSIPDACFGAPWTKYAEDDYSLTSLTVSDVLSSADKYRHSGCTGAHWISVVVSPLLNLVWRLKRYQKEDLKLAVLDLTTVEISPSTLCPTSSDSLFKNLDKRIDAALGLGLSKNIHDILIGGTASFVNFVPMLDDFEVKRPNTDKDPLIQLGTWIAAEFTKRKREGYSLDMPVLATEIDGDAWNLHMAFATEDAKSDAFQCNLVGPIEMGSTISALAVFQILDRLCRCADWGTGEYQTWFDQQVLSKYGESGSEKGSDE